MKKNLESQTALSIAFAIVLLSRTKIYARHLSEKQILIAEKTLSFSSPFKYFVASRFRNSPWIVNLFEKIQGITVPGIARHWILRKRVLRDIIEEIIHQNKIKQIVVLAGGFDALSYDLSERYPEVCFFETDHPATQLVKKQALDSLAIQSHNFDLVPLDYTKSNLLDELRKNSRFHENEDTIFLAEGLFMYLQEDVVMNYLNVTNKIRTDDSYFLFTYMNCDESSGIKFENQSMLLTLWLRLVGEPFVWGAKTDELVRKLKNQNFHVNERWSHEEILTHCAEDLHSDIAKGECLMLISTAATVGKK